MGKDEQFDEYIYIPLIFFSLNYSDKTMKSEKYYYWFPEREKLLHLSIIFQVYIVIYDMSSVLCFIFELFTELLEYITYIHCYRINQ